MPNVNANGNGKFMHCMREIKSFPGGLTAPFGPDFPGPGFAKEARAICPFSCG